MLELDPLRVFNVPQGSLMGPQEAHLVISALPALLPLQMAVIVVISADQVGHGIGLKN